jgi:hypothetical protein
MKVRPDLLFASPLPPLSTIIQRLPPELPASYVCSVTGGAVPSPLGGSALDDKYASLSARFMPKPLLRHSHGTFHTSVGRKRANVRKSASCQHVAHGGRSCRGMSPDARGSPQTTPSRHQPVPAQKRRLESGHFSQFQLHLARGPRTPIDRGNRVFFSPGTCLYSIPRVVGASHTAGRAPTPIPPYPF